MRHTRQTKDELDAYRLRRKGGRIRRFETTLPAMKISAPTNVALRSTARTLGVSIADVVRDALSEYLGVPAETPNIDNTKETR